MKKTHIVIAILEAKPNKIEELKNALIHVIKLSRMEKTCLEFYLSQDNDNPTLFFLYENWDSKEGHQKQFSKPYIIEFMNIAGDLLVKPHQSYMTHDIEIG